MNPGVRCSLAFFVAGLPIYIYIYPKKRKSIVPCPAEIHVSTQSERELCENLTQAAAAAVVFRCSPPAKWGSPDFNKTSRTHTDTRGHTWTDMDSQHPRQHVIGSLFASLLYAATLSQARQLSGPHRTRTLCQIKWQIECQIKCRLNVRMFGR